MLFNGQHLALCFPRTRLLLSAPSQQSDVLQQKLSFVRMCPYFFKPQGFVKVLRLALGKLAPLPEMVRHHTRVSQELQG